MKPDEFERAISQKRREEQLHHEPDHAFHTCLNVILLISILGLALTKWWYE